MRRRQIDDKRYCKLALDFYNASQKVKSINKKFDKMKDEFQGEIEHFFGENKIKSWRFRNTDTIDGSTLTVKMVERTTIEWDAEKLEKRLTKPIASKVIKKQYRITDMRGLSRYLKSCGVDVDVFKRYIAIDKTVDQKEVDRLGELGQMTVKDISGCYIVKCQKPYFTLSLKRDD